MPASFLVSLPVVLLAIFAAVSPAYGAGQAFTISVDYSQAPACQAFAERSKTLCEEWYPKIAVLLFGPEHRLPYPEVRLVFKPMKGVAATAGNVISISEEWVTKKAPDDYGMVIHELTHVVQDYRGRGEGWLTEGIADFIRDRHFEPGKRRQRIDRARHSYRQGYGTAAAFLIWLQDVKTKNPDLVRKLNLASHGGESTAQKIAELCGADADTLWKEFLATLPE